MPAFKEILACLVARYRRCVPDFDAIVDCLVHEGVIADPGQLANDHIAFRTLGAPGLGIASLEPFFGYHGYVRRDAYQFAAKHLDACWFAPPDPMLPRIFVSELRIEELSAAAAAVLRAACAALPRSPLDGVDFEDPAAVSGALQTQCWPQPSCAEYQTLAAESEYAAWTIVNGYLLNHITLSVHELRADFRSVEALNGLLERHGFLLNGAGGTLKVSPDGLLVQSSTVAPTRNVLLRDGGRALVAGPYIEFAERRVLPQFAELPLASIRREHRRDGFEAANADRIFESTDIAGRG